MAASCSEKLAISRDNGMKRSDGRMTGERGLGASPWRTAMGQRPSRDPSFVNDRSGTRKLKFEGA
jgi:hypothetical protein